MASLTPQQMNGANPSQSLNYYHEYFPTELQIKLESGAFESICGHLQDRSDIVPNIDMMSIAGFCRNCLAKVQYEYYDTNFTMSIGFNYILLFTTRNSQLISFLPLYLLN